MDQLEVFPLEVADDNKNCTIDGCNIYCHDVEEEKLSEAIASFNLEVKQLSSNLSISD